jgi:cardiolipin synthase
MTGSHQVAGNKITLLQNGTEYFPQLCADIDAARQTIYLETYIFAADETGRMIADALRRAATRGVKVHVVLDGYGSAELPPHWVDDLLTAGVGVRWFRREISPFTLQSNRHRRLRRMHRKMAVMDGEVAFVGGINIINDISTLSDMSSSHLDYAVRVQGAEAEEIQATMRHLWEVVTWASFRRRTNKLKWPDLVAKRHSTSPDIALVLRDNVRHRREIERAYLKAIVGAQREIIIANAYFLPGRIFRRALIKAAKRGVRVVLLLQGKVEYWIQHYATHALYGELMGSGIEVYEYQASYLHAKVAVVDGLWATVGSSNIDPFSLLLAREANLVIRDSKFAGELRASLQVAITNNAARIGDEYGRTLNLFGRMIAHLSYAVVRLLVGISRYRKRGT